MFGFGKKKKTYFSSKVLMTRNALDKILLNELLSRNSIVVTFFASTRNELIKQLNDSSVEEFIIPADKIINGSAIPRINSFFIPGGKKIILAERYPLIVNETQLAEKLEENGVSLPVDAYAAFNDALLLKAGGEKITSLMQRMGMKEDEVIAHAMIESSIEKFQSKITSKINVESHTLSPEEWFRMNLPAG
ncbi:hypothetical protein BH11BAC7_BH11BAC7_18900 [soil metagenome]